MRNREVTRTTVGELVFEVTDELAPLVDNSRELYIAVSRVVNDVLAHHQLRLHKRSRRKYATCFGNV